MLGALLQLLYQSYPLICEKVLPKPNFNPRRWLHYAPLREILILITPRAIGQGASTLALMVNTFFALQISAGAMTYVATTMIIIQVPIGLFGVATGFAALPVLTELMQKGELKTFSHLLTESLDTSCWLAMFTTLAFVLMMVPVYVVIFQHGAITFHDTILNCITICAYASGILFGAGSKVLLNSLYALNATRLIVVNSFVYLVLNTLFSALLTPMYGLLGLGLAFGLASAGNFWLNYYFVWSVFKNKHQGMSPYSAGGRFYTLIYLLLSLAAIFLACFGGWLTQHVWAVLPNASSVKFSLLSGSIIGFALAAVFLITTYAFGPLPLKRVVRKILCRR
jgi:putative peptidoglycan lipid II flippase